LKANAVDKAGKQYNFSRSAQEKRKRERIKMPIRRYLKKGAVFAPKTLSALGEALEATAKILEIGEEEKKRETVAKFLLRLAEKDDSLDAAALRDKAVEALGGVAYRDVPAKP
jgi:hypothetical protein